MIRAIGVLLLIACLCTGCTFQILGYYIDDSAQTGQVGEIIDSKNEKGAVEEVGAEEIIVDHNYDLIITLSWGANNTTDMDLRVIDQKQGIGVDFRSRLYQLDANNGMWLDYDYLFQESVATSEVVTILGMEQNRFTVYAKHFGGELPKYDPVVEVRLKDGTIETFTIPKQSIKGSSSAVIEVCEIDVANNQVIERMEFQPWEYLIP